MGMGGAARGRGMGGARACARAGADRAGAVAVAPVRVGQARGYFAAIARVARTTCAPGCGGRLSPNRARGVGGGEIQ